MAFGGGLEPPLSEPKSEVLPLDDPKIFYLFSPINAVLLQ